LINIRYFILIISIVALSWFVAIVLTQQRVQLEALNTLANIENKQTSFIWDFTNSEDIIESFKHYWTLDSQNQTISANLGDNPELSLNFSSGVVNSYRHDVLSLSFKKPFGGRVKIQFKTGIDDEYFYYSPQIKLNGLIHEINLNEIAWTGISSQGKQNIQVNWGTQQHKVSSLVLQFANIDSAIVIDSVNLRLINLTMKIKHFKINCNGEILGNEIPDILQVNQLQLEEVCYLPSNYMWLMEFIHNKYPGSLLFINNVKVLSEISSHRVNKSYTQLTFVNFILYALVSLCLIILFSIRKTRYTFRSAKLNQTKLFDFKSIIRANVFILLPTVALLVFLYFQKEVSISDFKSLPLYFVWALVQQYILGYLLAEKIFYNKTHNKFLASVLAALVFAIIHLPSITLFLLTFVAGTFWAYGWLSFKRIVPLALSHSLLALMFYHIVSDKVLYSAKVLQWFWE